MKPGNKWFCLSEAEQRALEAALGAYFDRKPSDAEDDDQRAQYRILDSFLDKLAEQKRERQPRPVAPGELPAKYSWIRPGAPANFRWSQPGTVEVLTYPELSADCLYVVMVSGRETPVDCDWISPAGEVESVVWCQDLKLAPQDQPLLLRKRGDEGEPFLSYIDAFDDEEAEDIHSWTFKLRGPRS